MGMTWCAHAAVYPGTIEKWLVSGPWPSYHGEGADSGLDTDFLRLETDAAPRAGDKAQAVFVADKSKLIAGIGSVNEWGFTETKTFDASWRVLDADPKTGEVTLDGVFKPIDDYFAAYAVCYVKTEKSVAAVLAVGSDDDHKLWLDLHEVGRCARSQGVRAGQFKYPVTLTPGLHRILLKVVDRTNGCGFTLAVTDRADKPIPGLAVTLDPQGARLVLDDQKAAERAPDKLAAKNAARTREIAALKARLPALEARRAAAERAETESRARLAKGYAQAEAAYAEQRARLAAHGAKSVDEPLPPAPRDVRRRLCVNGLWEASADGGRTWEPRRVPGLMIDRYFAAGTYPVARTNPKSPWCAYTNLAAFADFPLGKTHFASSAKFRTTFDWDGRGCVNFVSEGIIGSAAFACNGTPCGTYDGRVGVVTVPMKGARAGRNTLEIDLAWGRYQNHHNTDGLVGDVFFDFVNDLRVADVYAKPSWRKAELAVETELVNAGTSDRTAEVRAYAVKDGRVRFRLPPARTTVRAGETVGTTRVAGWADPVLWGIGGAYGEPELYDLVTDVSVDGRIVDRHVQPFGFREFWIRHTDFFLNGKRIILQGDTGHPRISTGRGRDVFWPLLRADGINIVRYHDSEYWSLGAARGADRMGMLCYLQMYPALHEPGGKKKPGPDNFSPFETWTTTKTHAWNLANYTRWFKAFRNSPSVVIWSTDNEILTQAWDTAGKAPFNVRNDRVGALYEKHMKALDPRLVLTRDGDIGTWGSKGRWQEDPPCDTANYHYPDFNVETWVHDWQQVYDWRPAVFGETLYCSYGAWDNWIGAIPEQVAKKARHVRRIATLYRELGVPGQIYMGLASDGFVGRDETGRGNPYGIRESAYRAWRKTGVLPAGLTDAEFPWCRVAWPALSGREARPIAVRATGNGFTYGHDAINVYNPRFPSHVRNAVNDAYRASLLPQPPLRAGSDAEAIVKTAPGACAWAASADGVHRLGVRADAQGRAWFRFLVPGRWTFSVADAEAVRDLAPRGAAVSKPGFPEIPVVELACKEGTK